MHWRIHVFSSAFLYGSCTALGMKQVTPWTLTIHTQLKHATIRFCLSDLDLFDNALHHSFNFTSVCLSLPWSAGELSGLVLMLVSVCCWDCFSAEDIVTWPSRLSPVRSVALLMTTSSFLRWSDASCDVRLSCIRSERSAWELSSAILHEELNSPAGLSWGGEAAEGWIIKVLSVTCHQLFVRYMSEVVAVPSLGLSRVVEVEHDLDQRCVLC